MAFTDNLPGSGTQDDPWIVTTYDELVGAADSGDGKYIKVNNDIDIADTYPNGDMPRLVISSRVDGNNKTISNWYKTTSADSVIYINEYGQITNLALNNIYHSLGANYFLSISENSISDYHVKNCSFKGVLTKKFASLSYTTDENFYGCSFKLQSSNSFMYGAGMMNNDNIGIANCYININHSSNTASLFDGGLNSGSCINSYIKCNCKLGKEDHIWNCVCEIHNDIDDYSLSGDISQDKNIFSLEYAPNITAGNAAYIAVPADKWLDTSWLAEQGFNITGGD